MTVCHCRDSGTEGDWRSLVPQGIVSHMDSSTGNQLRRGVVGPCILALLATGSRYGLQLVKELEAAGQLLTSQGTVYPLLNRLQDGGLVTSRWEIGEADRPRRYYEITDEGRRELEAFQIDWAQFSSAVESLMSTAISTHREDHVDVRAN